MFEKKVHLDHILLPKKVAIRFGISVDSEYRKYFRQLPNSKQFTFIQSSGVQHDRIAIMVEK